MKKFFYRSASLAIILLLSLISVHCFANGINGINTGTTQLKGYMDPVANLCLAIGGVVGLIGGVRVYVNWNGGDRDIQKELMGWLGSCIFLVLVSVVIKAFFS